VRILDEHRAAFNAYVPGTVPRMGGSAGQRGGGERHNYGELPHNNPLSINSRLGTDKSLTKEEYPRKRAYSHTVAGLPQTRSCLL
jgi:hypothetical protein